MRNIAMKRITDKDQLLSRTDASRKLGISERTFDRYFRPGIDKDAQKVGKRLVYDVELINRQFDELIKTEKFVEFIGRKS